MRHVLQWKINDYRVTAALVKSPRGISVVVQFRNGHDTVTRHHGRRGGETEAQGTRRAVDSHKCFIGSIDHINDEVTMTNEILMLCSDQFYVP